MWTVRVTVAMEDLGMLTWLARNAPGFGRAFCAIRCCQHNF